jgi:chemotaxis protein CheZ
VSLSILFSGVPVGEAGGNAQCLTQHLGWTSCCERRRGTTEELDEPPQVLCGRSEQRIFEACNFQDLNGQRIDKVMTTLKFVEDHITSVLDEIKTMSTLTSADRAQYLHGPRLEHDPGHVSQLDIDAIFDT